MSLYVYTSTPRIPVDWYKMSSLASWLQLTSACTSLSLSLSLSLGTLCIYIIYRTAYIVVAVPCTFAPFIPRVSLFLLYFANRPLAHVRKTARISNWRGACMCIHMYIHVSVYCEHVIRARTLTLKKRRNLRAGDLTTTRALLCRNGG